MVEEIVGHMMDALDLARERDKSKEIAMVITKLEEALLWYGAEQHRLRRLNEVHTKSATP